MIETVVIATDGSASVRRAVETALDVADRFEAGVHALYVIDSGQIDALPERLRADVSAALDKQGREAIAAVRDRAQEYWPTETGSNGRSTGSAAGDTDQHGDPRVVTAVREGRPVLEICKYAKAVDADIVATGTRGRHGEHSFHLGSVAENLVRSCSVPVMTVRQLEKAEDPDGRPESLVEGT